VRLTDFSNHYLFQSSCQKFYFKRIQILKENKATRRKKNGD